MSRVTVSKRAPSQGRSTLRPEERAVDVEADEIGRDREADAERAAGPRQDLRVDADEAAVHVDERAAELPGLIAASVWMNTRASRHRRRGRPRCGRGPDDAARHRLADVERVADGEHEIADLERIAIRKLKEREAAAGAFEPQDGEVGLLVLHDDGGIELALVGERDLDLGLAARPDDVGVGDDDAVRMDDHAGAQRVLHALRRHAPRRFAEERRKNDRRRTARRTSALGRGRKR